MSFEVSLVGNGQVAEIVLAGPAGNSQDRADIIALRETLDSFETSVVLSAVVVSGEGSTFCGGRIRDRSLLTKEEVATDLAPIVELNEALERLHVPIISAVEGSALGFGFGLAVLCDVTIAADDSTFALTELAHGIPPLVVLSYLSRLVPYKVAIDLALTGRVVTAAEAQRLGLVTEITAPGNAPARAREFALEITHLPAPAVRLLRDYGRRHAQIIDRQAALEGADLIATLLAGETPSRPQ